MTRVVVLGEVLLRLSSEVGQPLEAAESLAVAVAGAEANVGVALARLGLEAALVTCVPDSPLGHAALHRLRAHGVDLSNVNVVSGGRMGVYYSEPGVPPRRGRLTYDRNDSAFALHAQMPPAALDRASLLHVSGITLAVSPVAAEVGVRAMEEARRRGVLTSFDLNYRAALSAPAAAAQSFARVAGLATVLFVNSRDAAFVLGLDGPPDRQATQLREQFPESVCVVTAGAAGAWAADADGQHHADAVAGQVVDRIGRGDAFCAGFLWAWMRDGTQAGLHAGAALASLQQTYTGDIAWSSASDVEAVLAGLEEIDR